MRISARRPNIPTCPTVAKQFLDIKRNSLEGNFNVANFHSFAISFATAPTALTNCQVFPSVISMLRRPYLRAYRLT